jgi:C_GCAxxG_C_C family probable redox protein
MERSEQAKELFLSGHNCAQSVVLTFADDFKFSKELALKMAAGFGGGMGKQQLTCGAVTGALMVLGMRKGEEVNNNDELKSNTYGAVNEFTRAFISKFGTTSCKELTGCDLNTTEGAEEFKEKKVMETVCADCVLVAVEIIESL